MKMMENMYTNLFLFICTFPVLLIMVMAEAGNFWNTLDLGAVLLFGISICFGYFIYYCMDFLIGLIALLIDEIWAIRGVVSFCINMAAGYYLPIGMFPEKVIKFLEMTPFYYIYSLPIALITGQNTLEYVVGKFIRMIFWAGALFIASKLVFKKLIKRYAAFGG